MVSSTLGLRKEEGFQFCQKKRKIKPDRETVGMHITL